MFNHPIVHIEFAAHDPNELSQFYHDLFGWQIQRDETLDYTMFQTVEGGLGGGFNSISETNPAGTVIVYIAADDIEATLDQVEATGGKTLMPKTEIPDTGWMAIFLDPAGNKLGLYKSMQPPE